MVKHCVESSDVIDPKTVSLLHILLQLPLQTSMLLYGKQLKRSGNAHAMKAWVEFKYFSG